MLQRIRVALALVVVLAVVLAPAACNDDPAVPAVDTLNDDEVVALVHGLATVGQLTNTEMPEAGEPAVQCPLGGVVAFSGTVTADSTATSKTLRSEIVMTPQDCRFEARGTTFTASGAPDIRQTGDVTITGFFEQIEVDYDITGAVDWETGTPARQGTCNVALDLEGEIELPGVESADTVAVLRGTLSGTMCDEAVNMSLDSIGGD